MHLLSLDVAPFFELPYLSAMPGGGRGQVRLPFLAGVVRGLPAELDAIVLCSDLQGRTPGPEGLMLLGEAVPDVFAWLAAEGRVPPLARVGAVLAGDLYAEPAASARGATGEVRPVWSAFAGRFRWVAGVLGNHDLLDGRAGARAGTLPANAHLLDGDAVDLDGLAIGGVSGIVGKPTKPNRKADVDYLRMLRRVAAHVDLVVTHEPPLGAEDQRGSALVREGLDGARATLAVCGHAHWREPRLRWPGGPEVLNVDSRVVVLRREEGAA